MITRDVFPKRLTIFAMGFVLCILLLLFWINTKTGILMSSFHQEEIPTFQLYCGTSRLITENQIYQKLGVKGEPYTSNKYAIIYSVEDLINLSQGSGKLLLQKAPVKDLFQLKEKRDGELTPSQMGELKTTMQDYIEGYLDQRNKTYESHLGILKVLSLTSLIGTFLFFILMWYIYRLYKRNLQSLSVLETQLEEQKISSMNASKMAALGQMAAGIAHEINNPLAVIQVKVELGIEEVKDKAEQQNLLRSFQKIDEMSDRISKIISSMRKVTRGSGSFEPGPVNLAEVLEDIYNLSSQNFKLNDIEFIQNIASPKTIVKGDFNYISQVLVNLFNNAIDELKKKNGHRLLKVSLEEEKQFLLLKISDNAGVIPPHVREKIFDPFYTSKEVGKGTGLGLSISSTLAKDMGGELYLASSDETTFVLKLLKT